ncbi:putative DNA helicase [Helianthus anomalus]
MEEHDQYESVGLDESLEDERDLDQIMADRRAAEMELDARVVLLLNGSFIICFMIKIPVVTCSLYNFDPVMRSRLWWYNFDRVMRSRLGWCIEWLQANFLVLDDIMDESHTNRENFMTGYQLVFSRENLTLGCSHSRFGSLSAIREMEGTYRECASQRNFNPMDVYH